MEFNLTLPAKAIIRLIQNRVADHTTYFGIQTLKNPLDFWVYQELIWKVKPDIVVEIGNAFGGSALALARSSGTDFTPSCGVTSSTSG